MVFLDTDVISHFFFGSYKIRDNVFHKIYNNERVAVTSINVYELLKGLKCRKNGNKYKLFRDFLESVIIYTIDAKTLEIAAGIYADLIEKKEKLSDIDIFIASIVIANNGTLVSNNTNHYKKIKNLQLINWLDRKPIIINRLAEAQTPLVRKR